MNSEEVAELTSNGQWETKVVADLTRYDLGKRVIVQIGNGVYMYPSAFSGYVGGILNGIGVSPDVQSERPQAKLTIDGRAFTCTPTCPIEIEAGQ